MTTPKPPPRKGAVIELDQEDLKSEVIIHKNLTQDVLLTTEDKMKLTLIEYKDILASRGEWLGAAYAAFALLAALLTSDFKDIGPITGSTWQGTIPNNNYSVLDYARDMADETALTRSTNTNEPAGNDIAVYTIGLGNGIGEGAGVVGEDLLRYIASVGDDGDRNTNPCSLSFHRTDCGNYYYAPTGSALLPIFEDIATRIYTLIVE